MSSSVLVKIVTSWSCLWTWIRIPSIFHSTAAGDIRSMAAPMVGRGGRQHRPQRASYPQREGPQGGQRAVGVRPAGPAKRGLGYLGQRAAQLMSTADQGGRHPGCPRDGLRHDALLGALPEVPGQQPEQERALAVGGAARAARQAAGVARPARPGR